MPEGGVVEHFIWFIPDAKEKHPFCIACLYWVLFFRNKMWPSIYCPTWQATNHHLGLNFYINVNVEPESPDLFSTSRFWVSFKLKMLEIFSYLEENCVYHCGDYISHLGHSKFAFILIEIMIFYHELDC